MLAYVIDRGDVGRTERAGGSGFFHEPGAPVSVILIRSRQKLQSDLAPQPRVFGPINSPIPPAPICSAIA